jgi:hypothetical protein
VAKKEEAEKLVVGRERRRPEKGLLRLLVRVLEV